MISAHLRRTVRTLYAFACGYCGVSETEVGAYLTIDHFMPEDAGGADEIENLVYACHTCNMHKSAAWNPQVPPVLHPLRTDMAQHVRLLPDDTLQGITAEGTRHVATLHLNRPPMVERRKMRRMIQTLMQYEAERMARERSLERETRATKRKIRRKKTNRTDAGASR